MAALLLRGGSGLGSGHGVGGADCPAKASALCLMKSVRVSTGGMSLQSLVWSSQATCRGRVREEMLREVVMEGAS